MEGEMTHIRRWLLPLSWLYGAVTDVRNTLFDIGVLPSVSYDVPIISVGNITVGGTGKTPHVEYLIRLLEAQRLQVAVLSRGYKRRTDGYQLATLHSTSDDIGDEPWQIKQKFPTVHVAVDTNRRRGIERLLADRETCDTDVILLDDAYQHRYVRPGYNILLVDYHRFICGDRLLPAGNLRERASALQRATAVIVTKCPQHIPAIGFRSMQMSLQTRPYQQLFFSTFAYGTMHQLWGEDTMEPVSLRKDGMHVLLLTGIGNPRQMEQDVRHYVQHITQLTFPDHHAYGRRDAQNIAAAFRSLPSPRIVITTEKDAARLKNLKELDDDVRQATYVLPVNVRFMRDEQEFFNKTISDYVRQHKRNSRMATAENA